MRRSCLLLLGVLTVSACAIAAPIDVTAKVREAVRDNVLSIAVNNSSFGDPQMGQRKELLVEFNLGEKIGRKAVGENGVLEIKGSADKPLTIVKATYRVEGVHDYGLREYVYTSKDLPHSEGNTWKLVCQLPYNAQYTAWIQLKTDAAGKAIVFDSTNPLVHARQKAQEYTTVAGDQVYEVPEWVSDEGACYTIPAGVTVVEDRIRRGVFHSVLELIDAIHGYIDTYNQDSKPFVWTKTADQILGKLVPIAKLLNKTIK